MTPVYDHEHGTGTGKTNTPQVVQENSATAEQSSASSQELNDRATELKNMVAQITV